MGSRMDRYREDTTSRSTRNNGSSRTDKNQELYDTLYLNSKYTEFSDITNKNAVELTAIEKNYKTREGYHQLKEYQSVLTPPKVKRELEEFETLYPEEENKIYDINSVLSEAKKNREELDEEERRRKLRSTQYNILSNLNLEELEKYREEKKMRRSSGAGEEEEQQIQELIDTITSKTLAKDLTGAMESDLMSELLPSSKEETVITPVVEEESTSTKTVNLEKMDSSFYTKSMDLSDQDFEMDNEFGDEVKSNKVPLAVKILLFLVLVGLVVAALYFVIHRS